MAKTEYDALKAKITENVKKTGGSRHSKSDLVAMSHSMLNSPDYEVKNFIKDVNDPVTTKPVERYRDSLKPVLKQFGVDNAELDKVRDVTFNKEHAEAVADLGIQLVKDYVGTGRKLIMPINEKDESQMEISMVEKAASSVETKKIIETAPGKFEQVPTGKRKKTKKHKEMKVSNKVPSWLTDIEDV